MFKYKYLAKLREDRFNLIEDVKTVKVGNEMAVTLSIGIGADGASYTQNYEYARMSIDLALGRGGDQVVVREGEEVSYYGGKTQQVERNTRVKARVKAHALREIIESREHVIIMGHSISDVDCLGAAIGVYCAARSLGKKAQIVLNEITSSLRPLVECFTEENGYPADLFVKNEEALLLTNENTLVMVVDVNRPSYTECPELLKRSNTVCVFDHHRQTSEVIENPVLSYVEPYASSACEMIAEVLQYFSDDIKLGSQAANELLNIVGIKASFVLTEYQGKIYVSSRSIDEINVQLIMERLGGGGHLNMAGAQLTDCTVLQAKHIIQDTIDEMLKEGDIQE